LRCFLSRLLFLVIRRRPRSTLFPYTTLFRSATRAAVRRQRCSRRVRGSRRPLLAAAGPLHRARRATPSGAAGVRRSPGDGRGGRSEEHTSELQSLAYLACRPLPQKKTPTLPT